MSPKFVQLRWLVVILPIFVATAIAFADAPEQLQRGIDMFHQGNYFTAQETLQSVRRDELDDAAQRRLDDYLSRVANAVRLSEKATADFERAEQARFENRVDRAESSYRDVLANEYAAADLKRAADDGLAALASQRRPASQSPSTINAEHIQPAPIRMTSPSTTVHTHSDSTMVINAQSHSGSTSSLNDPATRAARDLSNRGFDALRSGKNDEAERLFQQALQQVPGYPEAVRGLDQVRQHNRVESAASPMIRRLIERNKINWERTVSTYRGVEGEINESVAANEFERASELLLRARQVIESGKQYAEPVSKYESLMGEYEALNRHVREEERRYNEQEAQVTREEINRTHRDRITRANTRRQRQIDDLMGQARELRRDRSYKEAIEVLEQVLAVDPTNERAEWLKTDLEDIESYFRERRLRTEHQEAFREHMIEVEENKVPWVNDLRYPDNWREIITRPTRSKPGEARLTPADREMQRTMAKMTSADWDEAPLEEVFEELQKEHNLNLVVVWTDLDNAGIDRDAPVTLQLNREVSLKTVMEEVLDQVGGGFDPLGYTSSDGLIKIATQQFLNRNLETRVYNVEDLIIEVRDFTDGPAIDIQQASGGGRGGGGQPVFSGSGGGSGDREDEDQREERAEDLIDMIVNAVKPDSWRDGGTGEGAIEAMDGVLIVSQTAAVHQELNGLLNQLREERAINIAIEARFLTIRSNYLEEMGIDLDIILNAGNAGFDQFFGGQDPLTGTRLLLPRQFSRLGFTPSTPGLGNTITEPTAFNGITQPFGSPALVPAGGGGNNASPFPITSNIIDLSQPLETDIPGTFGGIDTNPAFSVFGSFLDNIQVDFLVRATQADRRSSILNAPKLVLVNGQRSWVAVTSQVNYIATLNPIVQTGAVGVQPQQDTVSSGSALDVRAAASADRRYVLLNLEPSVARLLGFDQFEFGLAAGGTGSAGFVQVPTVERQVVKTSVTVPDGGTLLFGGSKTAAEVETEAGVPILSKIPILKRLYSSNSLVKDEQVLMILVKPKIIIPQEAEEDAFPTFSSR
jgi:Flp pilus assembly secretin CpaC/tetratricopeptide (TPR) repeat protein